jgi:hypothetical protein
MSQDMDSFVLPILLKQQPNGLKTNQTKLYGRNSATIGRDAATS